MKKIKSLIIALFVLINALSVFAGNIHGEKDPLEVTYIKDTKAMPDLVYQQELRKSSAWMNFLKTHNKWSVEFNESSQMPHRAFGKPIQVNGANPQAAAINFIETYLGDWNLSLNNLKFQTLTSSSKYYN
jgi:hypothetical protein